MQRLVIVSDAWGQQVNGVVTTLTRTCQEMRSRGIEVQVIGPDSFRSFAMPGYSEIRLAILPYRKLAARLAEARPDGIHISTEGPLGWAARRYCRKHGIPFTTSFHTRFPDYVRARLPIPTAWTWAWLRHFHRPSAAVMTATQSLEDELRSRGFDRLVRWSRGVDLEVFVPRLEPSASTEPCLLYLGRVAQEKNVEAFLALQNQVPGRYVVVGDGPIRESLQAKHPQVEWRGYQSGQTLRDSLAEADCMVFPSRTDTFGLVMIEAMACGTPVAAFPEQGPLEVIQPGVSGGLSEDLAEAAAQALNCTRADARRRAEHFSWQRSTDQFVETVTRVSSNRHDGVTASS